MTKTVDEGQSYTLRVGVSNTSTRGGVRVAASLRLGVSVKLETKPLVLIPSQIITYNFGATEEHFFDFPLNIPIGFSGASGTMDAWLERPDATVIGGHTYEALVVSGIHAMPPFPGEPPLPPAGTGVPTATEVAAVKATIAYRFQHLWFDVCAGLNYTAEMSQALVLSQAPMQPLVDRYTAELNRISDVWHAANDTQLNAWKAQMTELARQMSVFIAGFNSAMAAIPPYGVQYSANQPLNTVLVVDLSRVVNGLNPTVGYFTDFMSAESATIAIQWQCSIYDGGPAYVKLDQAYQSYSTLWQNKMGELAQLQLTTQRVRDTLRLYGVWYCGFSLGY